MPGNHDAAFRLEERCVVTVSGAEAESFLQNLVTQDVVRLAPGALAYSCLLTPQGRFLHDFFIFREGETFFLECETARRDDLIRRLKLFRLRTKVSIDGGGEGYAVYAGAAVPGAAHSFPDPRLAALGHRSYVPGAAKAESAAAYKDMRIHLGVPEGSVDIKPEIDTVSDANLDWLHAVSWDKGCFVGQEVTARMHNRALVKKRMAIVSGQGLAAGDALTQGDVAAGEIRSVNAAGNEGLALLKLAALGGELLAASGGAVAARLPAWAALENT
jgi:folate-binding protein YgfZ